MNKEKYAAQKMIKCIEQAVEALGLKEVKEYSHEQLSLVLKELGYLQHWGVRSAQALEEKKLVNQAYKYISHYKLNYANLCSFLLALCGIYNVVLTNESADRIQSERLVIEDAEGKKVHQAFDLLYRNRLSSDETRRSPLKA